MEIRAFAEQVLFGRSLEDKLAAPRPPLTDAAPGAPIAVPAAPGRPPELPMVERPGGPGFPAETRLGEPEARGRVLHFFANHELVALELMALALLRFPDAPSPWRRRLVRTMTDEQRHLGLYLDRMADTGVRFGDLPASGFLWSVVAGAASPLQFTAALALTFEQANLDFSHHFAAAFRAAGDETTAAVLDAVLADEIEHVRHGVYWLDRWRDPAESRWDAFVRVLPPPLTPARAKGRTFVREARRRADLDEAFIDRVEVYAASKGRPPDVYVFFADLEGDVAGAPGGRAVVTDVERDLDGLLACLAGADDVVVVHEPPAPDFLRSLRAAGFELPELVVRRELASLAGRKRGALVPWGWSPTACATLAPLGAPAWSPDRRELYAKGFACELLAKLLTAEREPYFCDLDDVGVACDREEDVLTRLTDAGERPMVVKPSWSTAGRGLVHGPGAALAADAKTRAAIGGLLARQGVVVVEPWLARVADVSAQLTVADDGVRFDGWGAFSTDTRGGYRGAAAAAGADGLPAGVTRFAHGDGRDPGRLERVLRRVVAHVGAALAARGFTGPAGVDALVYRAGDGLRLKPIVEINPRLTMGRVALALARRVRPGRGARWLHLTAADVRRAGFSDFAAFAAAVWERFPVVAGGTPPLIERGVLFTSDPTRARRLVTALVVGVPEPDDPWAAILGGAP